MTSYARRPERTHKALGRRFNKRRRPYCKYCKRLLDPPGSKSGLAFTKDHVKPKSQGGTRTVPCCWTCNQIKGQMMPREWFRFMDQNPQWWKTHNPKKGNSNA